MSSETMPDTSSRGQKLAVLDKVGQTVIVTITTSHLAGPDMAELMGEVLANARDSGSLHFILDMQNVSSMDSCCLGTLVQWLTQMHDQEGESGRIALVNAGHNVEYLFRLTSLDRVFPICRDVMTALAAVEGRG